MSHRIRALGTTGVGLLVTSILMAASGQPRPPHPLHTTLTEISHHPATHSLTIAIRGFWEDLGAEAAQDFGLPWAPSDTTVPQTAAFAYVNKHFKVTDANGRPIAMRWDRARRAGDLWWIYLEAQTRGGPRGLRVENALLFDRFDDQVNIVQAQYEGRRVSLLCTRGDGPKSLP